MTPAPQKTGRGVVFETSGSGGELLRPQSESTNQLVVVTHACHTSLHGSIDRIVVQAGLAKV
jgi:hypothetical protein